MRENTERPVTVEMGTNILAGIDHQAVIAAVAQAPAKAASAKVPPLWDGEAAVRTVDVIAAI